jgi:hypothetical protein
MWSICGYVTSWCVLMPIDQTRNVGKPEPGWFLIRLVRKGPFVPAKIDFSPEAGWHATVDGVAGAIASHNPGEASDVFRIWHGGVRIDQEEYDFRMARKNYAQRHAPDLPEANTRRAIDVRRLPPLWSATKTGQEKR